MLRTPDRNGCTPAVWASRGGRMNILEYYLQMDEEVLFVKDRDGKGPKDYAWDERIADFLDRVGQQNSKNKSNKSKSRSN
mmetsp:Transcript_9154/g.14446  ORF Transcript_9154/g.14446 Transcript_9154/m.14446 type:complete len:80 (+) Transcript_9154:1038-1277(+)